MSWTVPPGVSNQDELSLSQLGKQGLPSPPAGKSDSRHSAFQRQNAAIPRELHFAAAGPGDHPSIHHFLLSIFHGPSPAEFQAQLDDPFYEPSNRLVIKRGDRVVAHVSVSNREMYFGARTIPVALVSDLATLPEYCGQGCATTLLEAADRQMVAEGAWLGILRTSIPQFYLPRGWTVCGRHCFSTARPRDILSYLSATKSANGALASLPLTNLLRLEDAPRKLNIRLWRHVEQAALIRLYTENKSGTYGHIERGEAFWRWLISRRGYDRIYVAIDGPDKLELDDLLAPIVGYAAMKEGRIVELMASPLHPGVPSQLLARACGDAIERDYHTIRFDGPPNDPLHQVIELAGGEHHYHEAENGEVFMVKLFDPISYLRAICPQLHVRAKAAQLSRPCELGLLVEDDKYRLMISRRSVKLVAGKLHRSYITCTRSQLVQLLLGHLKLQGAAPSRRLEASTRVALEMASILFPSLPFWRPPLDDLPA